MIKKNIITFFLVTLISLMHVNARVKKVYKFNCVQVSQKLNKGQLHNLKNSILKCEAIIVSNQSSEKPLPSYLHYYNRWLKKLGNMHMITLKPRSWRQKNIRLHIFTKNEDNLEILIEKSKVSFSGQILFKPILHDKIWHILLYNEELIYDVMDK